MLVNELISVIVPVYNVEEYLNKCVISIINQTYKNLEIILIDDGSTDNGSSLCDEFSKQDNRVKVIHQENKGLSEARNTGILNSNGKYLAFIDSDDYIHPEFIEKLYHTLITTNADMSVCNYNIVNGEAINNNLLTDEIITGKQAIQKLFEKNNVIVVWNKLYKRDLFNNIKFPAGRINEDEFVVHRLFGQCNKIACIKDSLYFYYQRKGSIIASQNKSSLEYHSNRSDFLLDRMKYIITLNMESYAAKILLEIVSIYLLLFEHKNKTENNNVDSKIRTLKNQIKENLSLLKYVNFKQRIKTILAIYCPTTLTKLKYIKAKYKNRNPNKQKAGDI